MLRDPSVPATTSHWISHSVPSASTKPDPWRIAVDAGDLRVVHPEADVAAVPVAGVGQIDEDVCLRVQPATRVDQGGEVDMVPGSVEPQFNAVVLVPVGVHPVADA